jgi:hypothetical protein
MSERPTMSDYEPVDLSAWCNAGTDVLGGRTIETGDRAFLGLPFRIGGTDDAGVSFVVLGPDDAELVIPIDRPAHHVLVAHRRLPGDAGDPALGTRVATYTLELEGRPPIAAPLREGFELAVAPGTWAWQAPFLAPTVGRSEPFDRRQGPWGQAGFRQTEPSVGSSTGELFLWAWRCPEPGATVRALRARAHDARLLIAAVTLSHLTEEPFVREPALPVRITIPRASDAVEDALDVAVDRGVATYAYRLARGGAAAFLDDPLPGFGEPADPASTVAYVRLAASPSATVTVTDGGRSTELPWSEATTSGSAERDGVRIQVVESGRSWVHVRVIDRDTRRPVPCRVHFRSPDGVPYQPHGHHDHVNSDLDTWHVDVGGDLRLGRLSYAYIDGGCQGWLPVGEVLVDVARGFEYEPIRRSVRIARGQRELELELARWTSANADGWYSGDSHVHFLSAQGALTEQQGEDLNVVNLLQSQWGSLFTNIEDFTGRPFETADGRYVTFVSQENRQHVLGHLTLWGLREPVMPWCTDGAGEAELGGALEATESEWADRCHELGGTVVIPHFPSPNGEPATLIATGRADAVEMIVQQRAFHEEYYRYLNGGYRLPLVGGTDKMSSEVPVGLYRTYADLGDEPFGYDAWRAAVTAGRTFLSGGPLLRFSVDGHQIGDTVALGGGGTVSVSAVAEGVFPLATLQVVRNGEVVAEATGDGVRRLELSAEIGFEGDGWLAARCGGEGYFDGIAHRDVWGRAIFAHTSPIYVATQGDAWRMFDPEHARYLLTLIEGSLAYVRGRAVRYPPGYATHHHGEADHQAVLERPFLEAKRRVQERLEREERG